MTAQDNAAEEFSKKPVKIISQKDIDVMYVYFEDMTWSNCEKCDHRLIGPSSRIESLKPVFHFNCIVPKCIVFLCFLNTGVEREPAAHESYLLSKITRDH